MYKRITVILLLVAISVTLGHGDDLNLLRKFSFRDGTVIYVPPEIPDFSKWDINCKDFIFNGLNITITGYVFQNPENGDCLYLLETFETKEGHPIAFSYDVGCQGKVEKIYKDNIYVETGTPSGVFSLNSGKLKLEKFLEMKEKYKMYPKHNY